MKLKYATLLAIIGVIFLLIIAIMYFMIRLNLLSYINSETGQVNLYIKYLDILNIIGTGLLLPFFITLFKSQK